MNDALVIVLVLVAGVGGLVAAAYALDRRRGRSGAIGPVPPPPGPIGRILLWIARILVGLMVASIIGAFAFRSMLLAWLTAVWLALYLVVGVAYRIARLDGR
jgi:hypothetical protein